MEKKLREEAAQSVERGGTVYSKRLFNPEMDSKQIELNDPEFWEKMLQRPNADMLLQRLRDPAVMSDAASVAAWVHDLENLVKEVCEEVEENGENDYNTHEFEVTSQILTLASPMTTVFGSKACKLMLAWMEQLDHSRYKKRTIKRPGGCGRGVSFAEELPAVAAKPAESSGICAKCFKEEGATPGLKLVACAGRCDQQFHLSCVGLKHMPGKWKCRSCATRTHECMICHKRGKEGDVLGKGKKRLFTFYEQWLRFNDLEAYISTFGSGGFIDSNRDKYMVPEPVIKCMQHHCSCFYHMSCVLASGACTLYPQQHPCMFRCPRHYCCVCKTPANNQVLQVCVKCSHAYHASCLKTVPHTPLVKKYLICGDHPAVEEKKRKRAKQGSEVPRKRRKGGRDVDMDDSSVSEKTLLEEDMELWSVCWR